MLDSNSNFNFPDRVTLTKLMLISENKNLFIVLSSLLKIKKIKNIKYLITRGKSNYFTNYKNPVDIVIIDADTITDKLQLDKKISTIIISPSIKSSNNIEDLKEQYSGKNIHFIPRRNLSIVLFEVLSTIHLNSIKDKSNSPALKPNRPTPKIAPNKLKGRVLVVDDSDTVRVNMELTLKKYDLMVDVVADAESAFDKVEKNKYDLIFLDVILPEMNGYKACRVFKSKGLSKKIPVVMLTSKATKINKLQGIFAGCDKYLTKPVKAEELRTEIVKHIPGLRDKVVF